MIIRREDLGDDWPFTVDWVRIIKKQIGWILDKGPKYALSGNLESHGFGPLEKSGIWADDPEIPGAKKSITPLMEFLREKQNE